MSEKIQMPGSKRPINPEVMKIIHLIKALKSEGYTREEAIEKLVADGVTDRTGAQLFVGLYW